MQAIADYKASAEYKAALDSEEYHKGENITIKNRKAEVKTGIEGREITVDLNKTKVSQNLIEAITVQRVSTVLANGVNIEGNADKLGLDFNATLQAAGYNSQKHGKAYLFWNLDRLQSFSMLEMLTLPDEETGATALAIYFRTIVGKSTQYITLFEKDGYSVLKTDDNGGLLELKPKTAYKTISQPSPLGIHTIGGENYSDFPIVPLSANSYDKPILGTAERSIIDNIDIIASDTIGMIEKAKGIAWAISGSGFTTKEAMEMIEDFAALGIMKMSNAGDADKASIEPHTIQIPTEAVNFALDMLEKALYKTCSALHLSSITGGTMTATAVRTAQNDLINKVRMWETQQIRPAVRKILELAGLPQAEISFTYDLIANETEMTAMVMSAADYLDAESLLKKLPFVKPDEVQGILERKAQEATAIPSADNDIFGNDDEDTR